MKRVLTGIKPTGEIQLGNYLGAIRQIINFQRNYQVFLMIADFHAQTVPYQPKVLKNLTYDLAASLLALGVNPKKTIFFKQSDVSAHLYLYWILGCLTYFGELKRMHEFKEQSQRYRKEGVGSGIFMYPVLQAADILIYNADIVPIGQDQIQHLELTRELARRFNQKFKKFFKIPEIYLNEETTKIMSLDNPTRKMSKSLPEGCLEIFGSEEKIKEKIFKAVTDSGNEIKYDPEKKPAISNLMVIYKFLTNKSLSEIEKEFNGLGYFDFKQKIYEAFLSYFQEARLKKKKISKNFIDKVLAQGAKKANKIANQNLVKIMEIVGLK
ncbi:MAG: tryptophan--tRNA ligase [Candidatus Parcubacteria bacterium]|nr:MAG: tryptophan--tRNA ligase [Candidatus Parcubacteria bacterium]